MFFYSGYDVNEQISQPLCIVSHTRLINELILLLPLLVLGCFKDHIIGEDLIVDYLLYTLNKHRKFGWVCFLPRTQWVHHHACLELTILGSNLGMGSQVRDMPIWGVGWWGWGGGGGGGGRKGHFKQCGGQKVLRSDNITITHKTDHATELWTVRYIIFLGLRFIGWGFQNFMGLVSVFSGAHRSWAFNWHSPHKI